MMNIPNTNPIPVDVYIIFYNNLSVSIVVGRTIFSFPTRDPARLDEWLRIMGVGFDEVHGRPGAGVCDLHFNSKFVVSNQRRKILIGMAVPEPPPESHEQQQQPLDPTLDEHLEDDFGGDDDEAPCIRSEADDAEGMYVIDYEDADDREGYEQMVKGEYELEDVNKKVHINELVVPDAVQSLPIEISILAESSTPPTADADVSSSVHPLRLTKSSTANGSSQKTPKTSRFRHAEIKAIDIQPMPVKRKRVEEPNASAPLIGKTVPPPKASPAVTDDDQQSSTASNNETNSSNIALPTQAKLVSVRGVQLVQMPLSVFEAEQKMLRDELNYWKSIVVSFKEKLEDVEF